MTAIRGHLRHNLASYVVLVIALVAAPTSAYAVATIRSADIVDGQVMTVDIADDAVRSLKIRNGSIYHQDLAPNAVTGDRVANDSLDGTDLAFDSVTGYDVNESTLTQVPAALQGGMGRYGFSGSCDPDSATFVPCSNVQITLSKPGRLLVVGTVLASSGVSGSEKLYVGSCRINTDRGPILASQDGVDGEGGGTENLTVIAVTDVFPAGTHNIWVECYQVQPIRYGIARIVTVALGDG